VLELLDGLRAAGITVLASTHDMETASQRFELVALLNGRLIAYGAPAAVFTPEHLAAAFGGQALILDGMVVIDQCCPGHVGDGVEHRHEHGHQTELWHERDDGLRLWHERDRPGGES
jgi:ABC-type sulfate/molybdate transport systems ATPase subunit